MSIIAVAAVLGMGVGWAQVSEQPSNEFNFLQDLWQGLRQSGPIALLLMYVLWRVDAERRKLHDERAELMKQVLRGLNEVTTALQALQSIFRKET